MDFESFYSLFKLGKSLFASSGASRFLNGAAVFRPKSGPKPPAFLRFRCQNQHNGNHDHNGYNDPNCLDVGQNNE
jgi:hypothetical protein